VKYTLLLSSIKFTFFLLISSFNFMYFSSSIPITRTIHIVEKKGYAKKNKSFESIEVWEDHHTFASAAIQPLVCTTRSQVVPPEKVKTVKPVRPQTYKKQTKPETKPVMIIKASKNPIKTKNPSKTSLGPVEQYRMSTGEMVA
jgi:hypothetical protein